MQDDQDTTKLPNDFSTPAAPPDDTGDQAAVLQHPATDTNLDAHELYDEGVAGAAGLDFPAGSASSLHGDDAADADDLDDEDTAASV